MSIARVTGRTTSEPSRQASWVRIYGVIAIALASFLLTLAWWRPPIRAHVAVAQLELPQQRGNDSNDSKEDLIESVTRAPDSDVVDPTMQKILDAVQTPEFLDQAIPDHLKEPRSNRERPPRWQLSERLRIESRPHADRAVQLIRIRYIDSDPVRAFQVVKRVTEQLQQQLSEDRVASTEEISSASEIATSSVSSDTLRIDGLRWELQAAEQELESLLQAELAKCRASFLEQMKTASTNTPSDESAQTSTTADSFSALESTTDVDDESNAKLSTVRQDVQVAEYELERLLKERTPEHPSVIMVEAKLRDLRSELTKLQSASTASSPTRSSSEPTTGTTVDNDSVQLSHGVQASEVVEHFDELKAIAEIKSSDTYSNLSVRVESLREQYRVAEAAADHTQPSQPISLPSVHEDVAAQIAALPARVVTKPYIAHRLREPISRAQVIPAGLGSLGLAMLLVMLPASRVKPAFFTSAQEAASHLGMRLVGQLPTGDGRPIEVPKRVGLAPLAKRCIHLSEWFIVLVACTIIVFASVDNRIGHEVVNNPLQAYLQAVDGVRALLTGVHV